MPTKRQPPRPLKSGEEPLSERETRLLQRLLSDPSKYPIKFKNWIPAWLEDNPFRLSADYIMPGAGGGIGGLGAPVGTIYLWPTTATPSIPDGHFDCNGSAVSRTTYSALFLVYGTYFGSGDGSTTFNLPNITATVAAGGSGQTAKYICRYA